MSKRTVTLDIVNSMFVMDDAGLTRKWMGCTWGAQTLEDFARNAGINGNVILSKEFNNPEQFPTFEPGSLEYLASKYPVES